MPAVMAPRVRELQVGSEEELGLRRLAGGLVEGTGVRVNKTRRAQLTATVEAGLELQAEGQRMMAAVVNQGSEDTTRGGAVHATHVAGVAAGSPGGRAGTPTGDLGGARGRGRGAQPAGKPRLRRYERPRLPGGRVARLRPGEGGRRRRWRASCATELWREAHRLPFLAMDDAVTAWRMAAALWRWRRWRTERAAALPTDAAAAARRAASQRGLDEAGVEAAVRSVASITRGAGRPAVREHLGGATVHAALVWEGGGRGVALAAPARMAAGPGAGAQLSGYGARGVAGFGGVRRVRSEVRPTTRSQGRPVRLARRHVGRGRGP